MALPLVEIFCDESCHLEGDGMPLMVLGAVSVPHPDRRRVTRELREILTSAGRPKSFEAKWTKVSPGGAALYERLVEYFLEEPALTFRALVAHGKDHLRHEDFEQDHSTWYHKMYYEMLRVLLDTEHRYHIYLDIKDTQSGPKVRTLHEVLASSLRDYHGEIVQRVQIVRSDEVALLQLTDLLTGAVSYANRNLTTSTTKRQLIRKIERGADVVLTRNTRITDKKVNLFHWQPQGRR